MIDFICNVFCESAQLLIWAAFGYFVLFLFTIFMLGLKALLNK
jgi:hypothetical protein